MRQRRFFRNAWFVARNTLGEHELGFSLLRFTPQTDPERMAGKDTDACIDGFPRSGNTFAVLAFERWNPNARLAHHMHAPVQMQRAARLDIPCAALIRDPLEATSSLVVYYNRRISPRAALAGYINFYGGVLQVRERVVVCDFEAVLADPSSVVRELNRFFGTTFRWERSDGRVRNELKETIRRDYHARKRPSHTLGLPSEEKERLKAEVRESIALEPRLSEATALYRKLTSEQASVS
jgi:hypothetical protein